MMTVYSGTIAVRVLRPHGIGQLSEVCVAFMRGLRSFLDRPPPRIRDHDLANLDQRVAGHDHSSLHRRKPSTDEARQHPPSEAVAVPEQFLSGAMRVAGQQPQRAALL